MINPTNSTSFARERVAALFVGNDTFFSARRVQLVTLAARHALPTTFGQRSATLTISLRGYLPGQARVFGTAGWIDVLPRFHHPDTIVLHRDGAEPETITRPHRGGGYSHELVEVTECVRAGAPESAVMPLSDTLAVQDVLQRAAEQLGVRHAEDPSALSA